MALIKHRVNRIEELLALPEGLGAEIDLRSDVNQKGQIYLSHDAWVGGDSLESWLQVFSVKKRGPLILNTKEDGLEHRVLELLKKFKVDNFFFLDTTAPTTVKLLKEGYGPFLSVRFSKWEPKEFVQLWAGKVKWLWVDCFEGQLHLPNPGLLNQFEVCWVSPELQGASPDLIADFKKKTLGFAGSVCTKHPDLWLKEP